MGREVRCAGDPERCKRTNCTQPRGPPQRAQGGFDSASTPFLAHISPAGEWAVLQCLHGGGGTNSTAGPNLIPIRPT